jgi:hypothetical protein
METIDMKYPPMLDALVTDGELLRRVEKQSGAEIRLVECGKVSIVGSDQLSITVAYSMLEDAIAQNLDQNTPDKTKIDDTIKRVVLDVLEKNRKVNQSAGDDHDGSCSTPESEMKTNQIEEKGSSSALDKISLDDPGKYLKEFALSRGYNEEKVDNIFAHFGHALKFEVFYRALKNIIEIPENKTVPFSYEKHSKS